MAITKIEWANKVWNPTTGCTKVSEGCRNCYAERMAKRLQAMGQEHYANGFKVTLHPDILDLPLHWKKPQRIFVDSMSDLFHPDVPFQFIDEVMTTIEHNRNGHTFMVLTKRPQRMLDYFKAYYSSDAWSGQPISHLWLGVSAENQQSADERIPLLLQTPARVRFVSCEPLLGPIDMRGYLGGYCSWEATGNGPFLNWVIVGGESGHGARPIHPDWARSLRDQCQASNVAFFMKQWGEWWPGEKGRLYRFPSQFWADGQEMVRCGKKQAGDLLDGRQWHEFPNIASEE